MPITVLQTWNVFNTQLVNVCPRNKMTHNAIGRKKQNKNNGGINELLMCENKN